MVTGDQSSEVVAGEILRGFDAQSLFSLRQFLAPKITLNPDKFHAY